MALIDNLIIYYKLDEASGAVIDSTGNNHGTNNGATPGATGIIGDAYDFESTENDYIDSDANTGISGSSDRTLTFWIKKETDGLKMQMVAIGNIANSNAFGMEIDAGNNLNFYGFGIDFNTGEDITGTGWHFIAVTYNGTHVHTYLDGSPTSITNQAKSLTTTNAPLRVGGFLNLNDEMDGLIDEVGLWSRKLSDAEISELYNSGAGFTYPFSVGFTRKIKISSTFQDKPIKTKVAGTFEDKPIKIKVGGTFQDA